MASSGKFGGVDVLSSPASFRPLGKINGAQTGSLTNGRHNSSSSHTKYPNPGYHSVTSNGCGSSTSNGHSNGLAHCHDESDDDDDFYGAEERSCCSDSDFQDARDADFSSDSEGSVSSHTSSRNQGGYRSLLMKLHDEQAKRTALEAALQVEKKKVRDLEEAVLQKAGTNGSNHASDAHTSEAQPGGTEEKEEDSPEQEAEGLEQREAGLVVARMVSEAVGRAGAKAEAMAELEARLQKKDQELARLREKLQYWERMNQEMSQQNTHAIELLRQRRRTWKNIYRALYAVGAVGLAVGVVAALNLAAGPQNSEPQKTESSN